MKYDVRLYYHKGKLYALSNHKPFIELFELQRCMKAFHIVDKKLCEEDYRQLMSENREHVLVEAPFETKNHVITSLIITQEEDSKFSVHCETLYYLAVALTRQIKAFGFNEKFEKELLKISTAVSDTGESNIDTLSVFVDLNKDTFLKK